AALGCPRFSPPECRRLVQRPASQCDARGQASFEQSATTHTLADTGMSLRCFHTSPSFVRRAGRAVQPRALHRLRKLICETCDTASQPSQPTCGSFPSTLTPDCHVPWDTEGHENGQAIFKVTLFRVRGPSACVPLSPDRCQEQRPPSRGRSVTNICPGSWVIM